MPVDGRTVEMCRECAWGHLPGARCPLSPPCGLEIAGLLGHTVGGHRLASMLRREQGLVTVAELVEFARRGDLVLLGPWNAERVRRVLEYAKLLGW